jgi:hypothetical protein
LLVLEKSNKYQVVQQRGRLREQQVIGCWLAVHTLWALLRPWVDVCFLGAHMWLVLLLLLLLLL